MFYFLLMIGKAPKISHLRKRLYCTVKGSFHHPQASLYSVYFECIINIAWQLMRKHNIRDWISLFLSPIARCPFSHARIVATIQLSFNTAPGSNMIHWRGGLFLLCVAFCAFVLRATDFCNSNNRIGKIYARRIHTGDTLRRFVLFIYVCECKCQ